MSNNKIQFISLFDINYSNKSIKIRNKHKVQLQENGMKSVYVIHPFFQFQKLVQHIQKGGTLRAPPTPFLISNFYDF